MLLVWDPARPTRLLTDASKLAMSAILEQPDDAGVFHPVAFESRKLTQPERKYPPICSSSLPLCVVLVWPPLGLAFSGSRCRRGLPPHPRSPAGRAARAPDRGPDFQVGLWLVTAGPWPGQAGCCVLFALVYIVEPGAR